MNNILQQLKDNEKPFGLMSEEMQREIVRHKFKGHRQVYSCGGQWETHDPDTSLNVDDTYRLRADYEDEPEMVECEIELFKNELMYLSVSGVWTKVSHAPNKPDFIGFKFESGQVEFSSIVFKSSCSTKSICQFRDLADLEIVHATHVLFRRKKHVL